VFKVGVNIVLLMQGLMEVIIGAAMVILFSVCSPEGHSRRADVMSVSVEDGEEEVWLKEVGMMDEYIIERLRESR
jgi:hypothetical protein